MRPPNEAPPFPSACPRPGQCRAPTCNPGAESIRMTTTAFITGVTGMVGSHLADLLLAETDWDIHGMCRWRSPLDNVRHLLDRANRKDRFHLVPGDLNDFASLMGAVETVRPDYVFHLAAQSYPTESFTAPLNTLETNILGTARLLEALRRAKDIDPVIHVCSSSEVFGRVPKENCPSTRSVPFIRPRLTPSPRSAPTCWAASMPKPTARRSWSPACSPIPGPDGATCSRNPPLPSRSP